MSLQLKFKLSLLTTGFAISVLTSIYQAVNGFTTNITDLPHAIQTWFYEAMVFIFLLMLGTFFSQRIEKHTKFILLSILLWTNLWGLGVIEPKFILLTHICGGVLLLVSIYLSFEQK